MVRLFPQASSCAYERLPGLATLAAPEKALAQEK
jgi:hypothetical protein